ncbi:hypothetical protein D3C80_2056320 [compost metagenome]
MLFCTVTVPAWPVDQPRPAELMVPLVVVKVLLAMVLLMMRTVPPELLSTITELAAIVPDVEVPVLL